MGREVSMSGFDREEEPKTVRIKSKQPASDLYEGAEQTTDMPIGSRGPALNDEDLFKGLKAMLPFFLELELPHERSQPLSLLISDDPPPFISSVREASKGGERSLQTQRRAASIRESEIPFCGLLGCYQPTTTTVVVYTQGINWVLSSFEQELKSSIPLNLSNRPLRELYIPDPDQMNRAYRVYLRWLLRTLTIIHELGHAMVHLAYPNETPWTAPGGFEGLSIKVHEHLAQSFVATALTVKEIAAPFPQSDLTGVFHRLSLNMPSYCRAWAFSLPWASKDDVSTVLRSLRLGQIAPDLSAL